MQKINRSILKLISVLLLTSILLNSCASKLQKQIINSRWIIANGSKDSTHFKFNTTKDSCFIVQFTRRKIYNGYGRFYVYSSTRNPNNSYFIKIPYYGSYLFNKKDEIKVFTPQSRSYVPEFLKTKHYYTIFRGLDSFDFRKYIITNDTLSIYNSKQRIMMIKMK